MGLLNDFFGVFTAGAATVAFIVAVSGMQLEIKIDRKLDKLESRLDSKLDKLESKLAMQLVASTVVVGLIMYFMPSRSG